MHVSMQTSLKYSKKKILLKVASKIIKKIEYRYEDILVLFLK